MIANEKEQTGRGDDRILLSLKTRNISSTQPVDDDARPPYLFLAEVVTDRASVRGIAFSYHKLLK